MPKDFARYNLLMRGSLGVFSRAEGLDRVFEEFEWLVLTTTFYLDGFVNVTIQFCSKSERLDRLARKGGVVRIP